MGIPSYFSYIIKNYTNIIRKFGECEKIDHLFMDCNSMIYDSYNRLSKSYETEPCRLSSEQIEKLLIRDVVESIEHYLRTISPSKTAYIAFDGVPPFAKMDQQRTRRYKTQYMREIKIIENEKTDIWNTTAITPGTNFMNTLNEVIYREFMGKHAKWGLEKLWVSCSDEPGEGEHKLFQCLREEPYFKYDNVAVYGLDSDLIMLSIFHCRKYCNSIHVFREAPEFRTVLSSNFEPKEKLFMDIGALINAISQEMKVDIDGVYDYIFMCFFLGNDFMPHFPAFNIRTHGIQVLTETYSNIIGKHVNRCFISKTDDKLQIQWKWVQEYIKELAKYEYDHLITEYNARNKFDKRQWTENTVEERNQLLHNTPIVYRSDEKYICPTEDGWEIRYYRTLFGIENITEDDIRNICISYFATLEWVFLYYTEGCVHWRWSYSYSYPPLMKDLQRYILQYKGIDKTLDKHMEPFSVDLQLAYVLPKSNLNLSKNCNYLLEKYPENYPEKYGFQWAFCRYFWEAHILLPNISSEKLESLENELFLL